MSSSEIQELLKASGKGDIKSVQNLLSIRDYLNLKNFV